MTWEGFLDQLKGWLEERKLLEPRASWVVGASGGPDSTVLLHALSRLSRREELTWRLNVAHLHHGLRGADADADQQFVERMGQELDLAVHSHRVDLRGYIESHSGSTEEVARRWRYEFLERVALTTGSSLVAVAHHADDNAETVFHRICRGTGLRGLAGMPDVRPIHPGSTVKLVRPLLPFRREEVEALLKAAGLEARLDSSNLSPQFTRGRIRNVIMPVVREMINPNVSEALLRLAEQAGWLGTYLEDAAGRTFESLVVSENPGEIVLNTNAFLSKPRIVQAEVVRRAVSLVLGRDQDLTFTNVESVLNLAADRASGKELHLPGPILVRKIYERLVFRPLESDEGEAEMEMAPVVITCPGTTPCPALKAEIQAEIGDFGPDDIRTLRERPHPNEEWLDFERLRPPLILRGRHTGDRFWPLGAPGAKTVSDFFGDEKVDPSMRARSGILCDQTGPIWVIPLRIDERVKLRPTTRKVLKLWFRPA